MYNYETEKPKVFTEDGQVLFLKIRDRAARLMKESGAATVCAIIRGTCADGWTMLACVERLVELGELKYVCQTGRTQDHVLTKGRGDE